MRLLEIVRGSATSPAVIATAMALAKRLGKVGVVVGNCPGFVGNRMLFPYMYEAQYLVEEGATPQQVDEALTAFGMAMGPFAVDDMAGIDVAILAQRALGHFADGTGRTPLVQAALVEMGRLGQKTGKGWYTYADDRKAVADPAVIDLIRARAPRRASPSAHSPARRSSSARSTRWSTKARARSTKASRSAPRTSTSSTSTATGSPRGAAGRCSTPTASAWRAVLDRITALHREHGSRWTPAPLLERLAAYGRHVPRARRRTAGIEWNARVLPADVLFEQAADGDDPRAVAASAGPVSRIGITDRLEHWAAVGARSHVSRRTRRPRRVAAPDVRRRRSAASAASRRPSSTAASPPTAPSSSSPATASTTRWSRWRRCTAACRTRRSRRSTRWSCASSPRFARSSRRCGRAWCLPATAPRFERALDEVAAPGVEIVTSDARSTGISEASLPSHATGRRRARTRGAVDGGQDPVHVGIDRPAQGRDQHAADALRQPGAGALGDAVADRRARRCCATGCRGTTPSAATTTSASCSYNGGTLYIDHGRPVPDQMADDHREPARRRAHGVLQRAQGLRDAAAGARERRETSAGTSSAVSGCSSSPRPGSGPRSPTGCRRWPSRRAARRSPG